MNGSLCMVCLREFMLIKAVVLSGQRTVCMVQRNPEVTVQCEQIFCTLDDFFP